MAQRIQSRSSKILKSEVGRKEWMDFVKGVAIIMVVVYHTMLFLRSIEYEGGGMGRAKIVLELFPMPAFFLIAGMFHFRVSGWTFAETWKRRLAQYLYLYVLWSIIRFVFYLVVPNVRSADGAGATANSPLALLGILVWPMSSYWFIYALFVFTLLVWLGRKLPKWAQLAVAGAISVLFSAGLVDTHNVGWDRMGEYLIFFVIGVLFSQPIGKWVPKVRPWMVAVLFAVFGVISVALAFVPIVGRVPGAVLIGQFASIAFGFTASVYLVKVRALSWVTYLGVRSLNIYLFHVFVIAGLVVVVALLPILHVLPGRGFIVLFTVATLVVIICLILSRVLTRVSWLFVNPFRSKPRKNHGRGIGTADAPQPDAPRGGGAPTPTLPTAQEPGGIAVERSN